MSGSETESRPSETSSRLVATSFLALFAIVGLCLYGLPFYYDHYVRELGWTRTQVTSGNAISKVLVGVFFGYLAGWLIDRVGPRRPMIAGILLGGLALLGLSQVTSLSGFFFFYAFNALAYVLAGPLPNQVLLSRHFPAGRGRGRAMGIAYLGIGVGFLLVPKLSALLIESFGWRTAMRVVAALVVLSALPLVLLLREGGPPARTSSTQPPPSIWGPLRSKNFYLLLLGSMASVGAVGGANQHLKLLFSLDQHRSQADAASIISWVAAFSLVGRLGAGWLSDKLGPKRVMFLIYSLVVAAMLMLVAAPTGASVYLFAAVFGLGLGGEYLVIPLMASSLFGTATLGRVMGIVIGADGVAEAVFPVLVGRLRDSSGSYKLSFEMLAVIAALGALAIALLPNVVTGASDRKLVPEPATKS